MIRLWTRSITGFFHSPRGRVLILLVYYLAIIGGLILLYGKGNLTPIGFVYQGF